MIRIYILSIVIVVKLTRIIWSSVSTPSYKLIRCKYGRIFSSNIFGLESRRAIGSAWNLAIFYNFDKITSNETVYETCSVNTYLEYYFGIIFIETIGTIPNCETFDFDILQY